MAKIIQQPNRRSGSVRYELTNIIATRMHRNQYSLILFCGLLSNLTRLCGKCPQCALYRCQRLILLVKHHLFEFIISKSILVSQLLAFFQGSTKK